MRVTVDTISQMANHIVTGILIHGFENDAKAEEALRSQERQVRAYLAAKLLGKGPDKISLTKKIEDLREQKKWIEMSDDWAYTNGRIREINEKIAAAEKELRDAEPDCEGNRE